ncbi:hypothetical protein Poly59_31210 [Rubripirellula reticaptiva]|uniref:Uncharacterized protein n=2 Tax=Rubripirellula reticaptiva TaxID=2528013 RepID=A0A5C6EVL4_9BACT|nr:hypothetical protein Poly59_31210 [Rubripirellula reticaptiva]
MLTTADIKDLSTKRVWILVPAITVGVVAMFAYFVAVALCRDSLVNSARQNFGETVADFLPLAMILPSLGFFLAPLVWAERKSKRYALICPECTTDLSRSTRRVIATRCCGSCGKQIVEGRRIHGPMAFERLSRVEQRRLLVYWFWAWPTLGLLLLGYHWIDPTALNNCPQMLFIPGLIGTAATGWAFARSMDKRYIPQFIASAMVLCLGINAFW